MVIMPTSSPLSTTGSLLIKWAFRYLEDVATADVAFEAVGKTLEELFVECARATFEAMVDTRLLAMQDKKIIELESEEVDQLLFDWLAELVYLKDSEYMLFREFDVKIDKNKFYQLKAKVTGERIDTKKHELRNDVKAVTYHLFYVKKEDKRWKARVVLDI